MKYLLLLFLLTSCEIPLYKTRTEFYSTKGPIDFTEVINMVKEDINQYCAQSNSTPNIIHENCSATLRNQNHSILEISCTLRFRCTK